MTTTVTLTVQIEVPGYINAQDVADWLEGLVPNWAYNQNVDKWIEIENDDIVTNAIDKEYGKMYINTSERYGGAEIVTVADYQELNPGGNFTDTGDEIIESFSDEPGDSEVIAVKGNMA